jgi:hypothetical protein
MHFGFSGFEVQNVLRRAYFVLQTALNTQCALRNN